MDVRIRLGRQLAEAFIEACKAADVAAAAGVKLAVEWYAARRRKPYPPVPGKHTAWSKYAAERIETDGIQMRWPADWVLDRVHAELKAEAGEAVSAWVASGGPADMVRRTPHQLAARITRQRANTETEPLAHCTFLLGYDLGAAALRFALSNRVTIAAMVRDAIAARYLADTGRALPEIHPGNNGRRVPSLRPGGYVTCSLSTAWMVAVHDASGGHRQEWARGAVARHIGAEYEPKSVPERAPRPERAPPRIKLVLPRVDPRRVEFFAQAREQSIWPRGAVVVAGSITGRPYVGTVARDERAEGVAA